MSGRNRGRANPNQDADEERRLWKEIRDKARDVDDMVARSNEIGQQILQAETRQAAHLVANKLSDAKLDEKLEQLYRENVKLCEDVRHIIDGGSNEMNLLDSINILAGLREASEQSMAAQLPASGSHRERGTAGKLNRATKKAGVKADRLSASASVPASSTEDVAEDIAAAPSPRIVIPGQAGRLGAKEGKSSRAGSIPATRETSVKIEDGAESVASSADGSSIVGGPTSKASANARPTNRLVLKMGEIVFCRHDLKSYDPKKGEPPEGEGILCRVTAVIGEGKQRRYEVQDADLQGEPPPPQRASVSQLIQIPDSNKGLSDLPKGKSVLAQYPDTTTFYKAEVSDTWRSKDLAHEKGELVRLHFQDDEAPREVERKFVLTEK